MLRKKIIYAVLSLFLSGCAKGLQKEKIIYENNFENGDLSKIQNGQIADYNSSKVIGFYNNENVKLGLEGLTAHDLIKISFDLYIHDTWEGNVGKDVTVTGGPDIWEMKVNGEAYISTTFSNFPCPQYFCPPQSYPFNYLNNNQNPKNGAFQTDLPGLCALAGVTGGTSLYKITKTIKHSGDKLLLEFRDELKQSDSMDPKCDESWSMDNIVIKAITLR